MCLNWGHYVRSPGDPTGYGPGRRMDWDRTMSDVCHLCDLECVDVPAVSIHLVIEVCDGDIEVLDIVSHIGTHNLSWNAVWIAEAFVSTLQPILLYGIPRQGVEVMLHVALQAYRGG